MMTKGSDRKRGGLRVIYLHTPEASRVDLITVYGKDEADDLSKDELKALCGRARLLREQATEAFERESGTTKGMKR